MKSQIDGDKDIQGTALAGFYETENPASHIPALSDSKSAGNLLAVFAFAQITLAHVASVCTTRWSNRSVSID